MDKITIQQQINELQDQLQQLELEEQELKNQVNNPNDLIEYLLKAKDDLIFFVDGETDPKHLYNESIVEKCGKFKRMCVDSSYDDGSESRWTVYYFENFNCYVQFEGYYTSYNGTTFEDCFLVEPEEYMAIRYNKI